MIQPGVSALGKKNSTTLFPRKLFSDTSFPSSSGKVNSGAFSVTCMTRSPDQNLYRSTLYRRLARAVILAGLVTTIAPFVAGQFARKGPSSKGPRALGLLELAANGKALLVPITVMYDGKFYDGGAYKASPVPMALETDTVYEGLKTGTPQGLFTVKGARRVREDWIGEGSWDPAGAAPAKKPAPEKPPEAKPDKPPVLRHAGSAKPADSAPAPKDTTPQTAPAPAPAQSPTPTATPEEDKDRPVLRRGKKESETSEPASEPPAAPAKAATPATDSNPVQVMLAISDNAGPDSRPYTFSMKPQEEQTLRKKMLALAADDVRARDRQLAEESAASSQGGKNPGKTKVPVPTFEDVQLKVFDLTNANEPVPVLTAKARMPNRELEYYVTLVGHEDVYGEVHKAFANISDSLHLDTRPRLDLLDAVDADGDGRGELLFRRISDSGSAYDLYRVIGDKLYALYKSTTP